MVNEQNVVSPFHGLIIVYTHPVFSSCNSLINCASVARYREIAAAHTIYKTNYVID